jgi:hypothetical protein
MSEKRKARLSKATDLSKESDHNKDPVDETLDGAWLADGLEAAYVGYVERAGQPAIACYNREKVLSVLEEDGMSFMDAREHFDFNILGDYVGDTTPCFLTLSDFLSIKRLRTHRVSKRTPL